MRKMSGQVVSSKRVSLSRAATLMSRFAAVEDNGSSPTVSMYLQRAAEAFNHLAEFHNNKKRDNIVVVDNDVVVKSEKKKKKRKTTDSDEKNKKKKKKTQRD